ncbi:hypothetical protein BASA81_001081 [Batrachochytrium salamandrivorans]|nr:hypothetical protein BASA81_001081 [Batrachochytrium salamandrivorans]
MRWACKYYDEEVGEELSVELEAASAEEAGRMCSQCSFCSAPFDRIGVTLVGGSVPAAPPAVVPVVPAIPATPSAVTRTVVATPPAAASIPTGPAITPGSKKRLLSEELEDAKGKQLKAATPSEISLLGQKSSASSLPVAAGSSSTPLASPVLPTVVTSAGKPVIAPTGKPAIAPTGKPTITPTGKPAVVTSEGKSAIAPAGKPVVASQRHVAVSKPATMVTPAQPKPAPSATAPSQPKPAPSLPKPPPPPQSTLNAVAPPQAARVLPAAAVASKPTVVTPSQLPKNAAATPTTAQSAVATPSQQTPVAAVLKPNAPPPPKLNVVPPPKPAVVPPPKPAVAVPKPAMVVPPLNPPSLVPPFRSPSPLAPPLPLPLNSPSPPVTTTTTPTTTTSSKQRANLQALFTPISSAFLAKDKEVLGEKHLLENANATMTGVYDLHKRAIYGKWVKDAEQAATGRDREPPEAFFYSLSSSTISRQQQQSDLPPTAQTWTGTFDVVEDPTKPVKQISDKFFLEFVPSTVDSCSSHPTAVKGHGENKFGKYQIRGTMQKCERGTNLVQLSRRYEIV